MKRPHWVNAPFRITVEYVWPWWVRGSVLAVGIAMLLLMLLGLVFSFLNFEPLP